MDVCEIKEWRKHKLGNKIFDFEGVSNHFYMFDKKFWEGWFWSSGWLSLTVVLCYYSSIIFHSELFIQIQGVWAQCSCFQVREDWILLCVTPWKGGGQVKNFPLFTPFLLQSWFSRSCFPSTSVGERLDSLSNCPRTWPVFAWLYNHNCWQIGFSECPTLLEIHHDSFWYTTATHTLSNPDMVMDKDLLNVALNSMVAFKT